MIDVKDSFKGGLDLDTSYYKLNRESYVEALNITRGAVTSNQDDVVTNIVGNRLVDYDFSPYVSGSIVFTTGQNPFTPNGSNIGDITAAEGSSILVQIDISNFTGGDYVRGNIGVDTQVDDITATRIYIIEVPVGGVMNFNLFLNGQSTVTISIVTVTGTFKCIGAYPNTLRNTIVYMVYNTADYHVVLEYNNATRTIVPIFQNLIESGNVDVLGFTASGKITSINIYNREEGDLLFFLDSIGRPTTMNITLFKAQTYLPVTRDILDVCRRPPLSPPTGVFGNDTTRIANNFQKKLTRYKYRWIYDDNEKSVFSPIGPLPFPVNINDPVYTNVVSNNNVVTLSLNSGPQNVKEIELAVSISENSNVFERFGSAQIINKDDEGILDNVDFSITFYNDSTYPFLTDDESLLLFDYVPDLALAQEMPNGDVLAYGGITEGYDKDLVPNVVVTILTVAAGGGIAPGGLNGVMTTVNGPGAGNKYTSILFSGIPVVGTVITFRLRRISTGISTVITTYTTVAGDTASSVVSNLFTNTSAFGVTPSIFLSTYIYFLYSSTIYDTPVLTLVLPASSIANNSTATWKWSTERNVGLVYYDQKGKTNGVVYNSHITFPPYAENGSQIPLLPYINMKIYHVPPDWAYSYQVVFTKEGSQYLFFDTIDVNTSEAGWLYFDITNLALNQSKQPTTESVISWTFQDGDRIRLIRGMVGGGVFGASFETAIEGIVTAPRINNVVQTDKTFVKVKNVAPFNSGAYATDRFIIELFRPGQPPPGGTNAVYYECGVQYPILNPTTSTRVHAGQVTDQSTNYVTPAEINIYEGDSYYRNRSVYLSETGLETFNIQDRNFVDFYISAVSSVDGRALAIEVNAKRAFYGAFIRHSTAYQPNTSVNGLNRFYPNNFLDCDYSFGNIIRLVGREKFLKVFQSDKTGRIPLFNQISRDQAGNAVQVVTDRLLNPIEYYVGNWGIGTAATSITSFNFADYFVDNIRGAILRSSYDGVDVLSILYKTNSWATEELPLRTGDYHTYGAFDQKLNNYILALETSVLATAMRVTFSFKFTIGFAINRYFFSLGETPGTGDTVVVTLFDGNSITKTYTHVALPSDTLTTIAAALMALINADIYFIAIAQSIFPTTGLNIRQVTGNNPSLFTGSVAITYGSESSSQAQTLVFSEAKFSEANKSFDSFISLKSEMMCTLGTLLVAWKDGELWTHDHTRYNSFFGVDYESSITMVFNDNVLLGKTPLSVDERANTVWDCPEITTEVNTYGSTQQQSNLVAAEFQQLEGRYSAAFKRDSNSPGGKINGQTLKGNWVKVKFRKQNASSLVTLNIAKVYYVESSLNNR